MLIILINPRNKKSALCKPQIREELFLAMASGALIEEHESGNYANRAMLSQRLAGKMED